MDYFGAPLSYLSHGIEWVSGLDYRSANAYPFIHNSWVPFMQKGVFGNKVVKTRVDDFRNEILTYYASGIYGNHSNVDYEVDLNKGPESHLQGILGTASVGYKAYRVEGSNEIKILWYFYDQIDAKSFSEFSKTDLSVPTHRIEASADIVWDNILQAWYNFRVSQEETIYIQ